MRLIDADRFLEYMTDKCDMSAELDPIILGIFRGALKEQPTAYSVDKVVEELEENASRYTKKYTTPYGNNGYKDTKAISIHKAIEIVKHGGVSDDVCKWKYTKEIMDNAEFKVGCNPNALKRGVVPNNFSYHDFKYCPYCGKKIKVVE